MNEFFRLGNVVCALVGLCALCAWYLAAGAHPLGIVLGSLLYLGLYIGGSVLWDSLSARRAARRRG